MIYIAAFHFEFIEFGSSFVMGICVIPVLDEILFKFLLYVDVGWGQYRPPHDPVFHASFPFGDCSALYEGEGVCDFSIGISHDWGIRI